MGKITVKHEILRLREEGLSYRQIEKELGCSKSTISYHLGKGQKEKSLKRRRKFVESRFFQRNLSSFLYSIKPNYLYDENSTNGSTAKQWKDKYYDWIKPSKGSKVEEYFSYEQLMDKIGDNPVCYLSGRELDLSKPRQVHFDHIVPRSSGGGSSLENLGVTTADANRAKGILSVEEFLLLCKDVLEYNGYEVKKLDDSI